MISSEAEPELRLRRYHCQWRSSGGALEVVHAIGQCVSHGRQLMARGVRSADGTELYLGLEIFIESVRV